VGKAMTQELSDADVFGTSNELSDADVFGTTSNQPTPTPSFSHRVLQGLANISEPAIQGGAELVGNMVAPFLSDEDTQKLQDKGILSNNKPSALMQKIQSENRKPTLDEYQQLFAEGVQNSPLGAFNQAAYGTLSQPLAPIASAVGSAARKLGVPEGIISDAQTLGNVAGVAGLGIPKTPINTIGNVLKAGAENAVTSAGEIASKKAVQDAVDNVAPQDIHRKIYDAYKNTKDTAQTLYGTRDAMAAQMPVDSNKVIEPLSSIATDISNSLNLNEQRALPKIKTLLDKADNNNLNVSDIIDLQKTINANFDSSRYTTAIDNPFNQLRNTTSSIIDTAKQENPLFGQAHDLADNYYVNRVVPFENPVLDKFFKPQDYWNYKSLESGKLNELPLDTQQRAAALTQNIKTPQDYTAIRRLLPNSAPEAEAFDNQVKNNLGNSSVDSLKNALYNTATFLSNPVIKTAKIAGNVGRAIYPNITPEDTAIKSLLKSPPQWTDEDYLHSHNNIVQQNIQPTPLALPNYTNAQDIGGGRYEVNSTNNTPTYQARFDELIQQNAVNLAKLEAERQAQGANTVLPKNVTPEDFAARIGAPVIDRSFTAPMGQHYVNPDLEGSELYNVANDAINQVKDADNRSLTQKLQNQLLQDPEIVRQNIQPTPLALPNYTNAQDIGGGRYEVNSTNNTPTYQARFDELIQQNAVNLAKLEAERQAQGANTVLPKNVTPEDFAARIGAPVIDRSFTAPMGQHYVNPDLEGSELYNVANDAINQVKDADNRSLTQKLQNQLLQDPKTQKALEVKSMPQSTINDVEPELRAHMEGVIQELKNGDNPRIIRIERDGQGSTPEVMGQKSTNPQWFQQSGKHYNATDYKEAWDKYNSGIPFESLGIKEKNIISEVKSIAESNLAEFNEKKQIAIEQAQNNPDHPDHEEAVIHNNISRKSGGKVLSKTSLTYKLNRKGK
jgi:hypothetical protein